MPAVILLDVVIVVMGVEQESRTLKLHGRREMCLEVGVQLPDLLGGIFPAKRTGAIKPGKVKSFRERRIVDDGGDRRGEPGRVAFGIRSLNGHSGIGGDLEHGRVVGVHDGRAKMKGLDDGQAEAFHKAREHEHGGAIEYDSKVGVGQKTEGSNFALG